MSQESNNMRMRRGIRGNRKNKKEYRIRLGATIHWKARQKHVL